MLTRAGALKDALAEADGLVHEAPDRAEPLLAVGDCYEEQAKGQKAAKARPAGTNQGDEKLAPHVCGLVEKDRRISASQRPAGGMGSGTETAVVSGT